MSLDQPSSPISSLVNTARLEVDNFMQHQNNPVKASQNLNSLLRVLHNSCDAIESQFKTAEMKPGDPENVEIEKVMKAIREIESFAMHTKSGQEKVNALNATFFWDKLKKVKGDLNRLSKKQFKRGERVEKVEKVNKSRSLNEKKAK